MKVRCERYLNLLGTEEETSSWLSIGRIYHVLEILIDPYGKDVVKFRIWSEKGQTPILVHASGFELLTSLIPKCWVVSLEPKSLLYLAPSEWKEPGYWEQYFDKNERAQNTFERIYKEIVAEEP